MYHFLERSFEKCWSGHSKEAMDLLPADTTKWLPHHYVIHSTVLMLESAVSGNESKKKLQLSVIEKGLTSLKKYKKNPKSLAEAMVAYNVAEKNARIQQKYSNGVVAQDPLISSKFKDLPTLQYKSHAAPVLDVKEMLPQMEYEIKVVKANLLLWKGMTQVNSNMFVKAGFNFRSAWKNFESLYKQYKKDPSHFHPDLQDEIRGGVGTFLYLLSILPDAVMKILSVLGFKADKSEGVQLLHQTIANDSMAAPGSCMILGINYMFLQEPFVPMEHVLKAYKPDFEFIMSKYGDAPFWRFLAAHFVKKRGDLTSAKKHLDLGITTAGNIKPMILYFERGETEFAEMNFQASIPFLKNIAEVPGSFDPKSSAVLIYCGALSRDKSTEALAKKTFLEMSKFMSKKNRSDKFILPLHSWIKRVGGKKDDALLQMIQVGSFHLLYMRNEFLFLEQELIQKWIKEVDALGSDLETKVKDPSVRISKNALIGHLYRGLKDLAKAEEFLLKAISDPEVKKVKKTEAHFVANACFELADIYFHQKKYPESRKYLKQASSYKSCAFNELIRIRCSSAKKLIPSK